MSGQVGPQQIFYRCARSQDWLRCARISGQFPASKNQDPHGGRAGLNLGMGPLCERGRPRRKKRSHQIRVAHLTAADWPAGFSTWTPNSWRMADKSFVVPTQLRRMVCFFNRKALTATLFPGLNYFHEQPGPVSLMRGANS